MPHSLMYHGGKGGANGKWIVSQLPGPTARPDLR